MDKPVFKKKIQATALQKDRYDEFCEAVRTLEKTLPPALFLTESRNHKNFDVMFFEDKKDIVLRTKYAFKEIPFPEPVDLDKVVFDTEWEEPCDTDWKETCNGKYVKFYGQACEINGALIDKWLDEAYTTISKIDSKYSFSNVKEGASEEVFIE